MKTNKEEKYKETHCANCFQLWKDCKCKLPIEEKKCCPKCNSEDITFYPLAYFYDYKCSFCLYKFDTPAIKYNTQDLVDKEENKCKECKQIMDTGYGECIKHNPDLVDKEEAEIIDKAMPPIINKDNWEENYPIPDKEEWEIEFEKIIMAFAEHADGIGANFVRDKEIDKVKHFIQKVSAQSYDKGQREYKQFILNVLDGQDIADKEMGVVGGTKTIRFALKSRIITNQ